MLNLTDDQIDALPARARLAARLVRREVTRRTVARIACYAYRTHGPEVRRAFLRTMVACAISGEGTYRRPVSFLSDARR